MNRIEREIRNNSHNRIIEINYMFSKLNEVENPIDKYFLARSTLVFTYGTLEKFIKEICELTLKVVIDNSYYNNNYVKELMQVLKYQNNPAALFDLLMYHRDLYHKYLEQNNDKGYFSRNGRIDSIVIAHIVNVFNLNRFGTSLKIPKIAIDTIAKKRMQLAHGEYMRELHQFGPSRQDLRLEEINEYIENEFKLNDTTRSEILSFINDFTNTIIVFINDIIQIKGADFKS